MLVNVQFLRFVAAMLVVVYHTSAYMPHSDSTRHGLLELGTAIGFAGVDIFFVISGFIMAHTTLQQGGGQDGWNFSRRRLARIYSGHWPFFALSLLVFAWARPEHLAQSNLFASFLLWPQPLNQTLLEITWTLSYELYFYLLFALLIWWVPRSSRPLVCLVITCGLLLLALYRHYVADSFGLQNFYYMPLRTHFLLSPFVLEFFAGTLVAYWLQERNTGWSRGWLAAGIGLFVLSGAWNAVHYDGQIEQGFHVVPRVLGFGLASVMIVAGLVRMEQAAMVAPRRFSLLTGGASYAIYLSHILILALLAKLGLFGWIGGLPFGLATVAAGLVMLTILAYSVAHYRMLERPLHRRFKRWLQVDSG
jgi:peptidoglycan/LPS O-acetylase OafA/YrhL